MKILETGFGNGENFLRCWARWKADSTRSRHLHYVAIIQAPIDLTAARSAPGSNADSELMAGELAAQCWGLLSGFHRLVFESGQVLLTLCVGDLRTQLKAQQFEADVLTLSDTASGAAAPCWDQWAVKALTRCCRRGTTLSCEAPASGLIHHLQMCGFELSAADTSGRVTGHYNPRWEPRTSNARAARLPGWAVVVGAGLAGASAASSLARRGWQVTVLDSAQGPADGASGLPVGLMVPHATGDDSPRSRLSRCGMRMTLQQAKSLLARGQDWDASGVLERRLDGSPGLPADWPHEGRPWSHQWNDEPVDKPRWRAGLPDPDLALWHGTAAWVKPASLVRAWLAQPGIRFQGNSAVASIHRHDSKWSLKDAADNVLAQPDLVVLANAAGAIPLLQGLIDALQGEVCSASALAQLQTVEGQVSWARQRDADALELPPFPVNGLGSLIGHVPIEGGPAWFAGATFEREGEGLDAASGHLANLQRVQTLLPASGRLFAEQLQNKEVQAWRNTRCTGIDRMPLCGPLVAGEMPGLWITTALGARGLSLTVLCAELLAARISAEPWPIDAKLAQSLDSTRKTR